MKVSIVIPNWNGRKLMEKHLPEVIRAKTNSVNKIVEIIIVDDKSTDDSVTFLESNYIDQIKLVRHTKNRGFSVAVNTGVRTAKGDIVCLLNTDVEPSERFLEAVLRHFKNKKVFGVSLHEKGFGFAKGAFRNGFIVHDPGGEPEKEQETFWVNGGSGVFRRAVWIKLKGFDEKILHPFYWEDVDLSYRAQKRDYILLWEPKAEVIHEHESTISENNFRRKYLNTVKERNQLLLVWKNITSPNLMQKHLVGLLKRMLRHPGYIRIVFKALGKIGLVRKQRRIEKKQSKVSDEAIFAKFN